MCWGISSSGFYAWATRTDSKRTVANRQLLDDIRRIHTASRRSGTKPFVKFKAKELNRQLCETEPIICAHLLRKGTPQSSSCWAHSLLQSGICRPLHRDGKFGM